LWNYEIRVRGAVGRAIRAELAECDVEVGDDSSTIRAALADQAALFGLLERLRDMGVEIEEVRRGMTSPTSGETPSPPRPERSAR
jgi:hypothetical protein